MARLEVLSPPALRARSPEIDSTVLVGRSPDVDWRIDEPTVSRRHALVRHLADHDEIEDLGSTGGTRVNGRQIVGAVALSAGDMVELAGVRLRYVDDGQASAASFGIRDQHGGVVSNVGRDQYNQYVQHVIVQRDDALRHVASMGRIARVLVIIGGALSGAGVLGFIGSIVITMAVSFDDPFAGPRMPEIAGVPAFAVMMGVALVGMAIYLVGILVHLSARRQRQEVDRVYPLPTEVPRSDEEW